jgi:uncharacterized membrane protein
MENKPPIWTYFTIALCGLWLICSSVTFGYRSHPLEISDLLSGLLLIILSLWARNDPTQTKLWILAIIGIWLQFAPLLFWAPTSGAYVTNTLTGAIVIALTVIFFQPKDCEPSIPPGWTYNPSSWAQRFPIAFFAFVCWMTSRYLAAYQLGYVNEVWDPFFHDGTKRVLESSVSKAFPVPDAGLGAFAYTLEFFATLQGGKARWRTSPWGVLLFGILVVPVGIVSVILIILQPLVVGTWCSLCLLTALFMLIPIPLAIDEVIATIQYLRKAKSLRILFTGGESNGSIDEKSPSMESPFLQIIKASFWGVTIPWNLMFTTILGIFLMTLKGLDPMLGALTIVISVIAFAEHLRFVRYFNILIALLILFFAMMIEGDLLFHLIMTFVLILLSIRKGPIKYANHSL